jgi:hypothetical protein
MKKNIIITLLFIGLFYSSYAFDNDTFYYKNIEYKGIKKITEKAHDKWEVISFFDEKGFLLQKISYYKKKIRSDVKYDYTVTDTLLEIRRVTLFNINADNKTKIDQYYYTSSNQCYKYRVYFSESDNPSYYEDNFVYDDGILVSYTQGKNSTTKFIYEYNEKKQKVQKLETRNETDTTFFSYVYNQSGQLTDYVKESNNNEVIYSNVITWSNKKKNKIHIRYSNFDKRKNWTRSYFITEKGKVFRSERKIEYW